VRGSLEEVLEDLNAHHIHVLRLLEPVKGDESKAVISAHPEISAGETAVGSTPARIHISNVEASGRLGKRSRARGPSTEISTTSSRSSSRIRRRMCGCTR
jgi:hypothetical protein